MAARKETVVASCRRVQDKINAESACSLIRMQPRQRWAAPYRTREREREEGAPSTRKFLVALGSVMVVPSMSFVTLTWQPRRDVSVRPNARSSMSCAGDAESACEELQRTHSLGVAPVNARRERATPRSRTHILIVVRLLELVVHVLLQDDMAR